MTPAEEEEGAGSRARIVPVAAHACQAALMAFHGLCAATSARGAALSAYNRRHFASNGCALLRLLVRVLP
ncbi:hypothetical protein PXNS11_110154 [Stutzerimonas xanthomarina]|nr:hypothetical protein PXNS11_110154 [Stutzerimonas xanthomarina]